MTTPVRTGYGVPPPGSSASPGSPPRRPRHGASCSSRREPTPPGLLLASIATLGLGLAALYGTRARPRLRVDASGLAVRGLVGSRHHPWVRVDDVRVLALRRLGRESTLLEIDVTEPDGSERMMIFGRLELDDDPADVAEAIRAVRPGR